MSLFIGLSFLPYTIGLNQIDRRMVSWTVRRSKWQSKKNLDIRTHFRDFNSRKKFWTSFIHSAWPPNYCVCCGQRGEYRDYLIKIYRNVDYILTLCTLKTTLYNKLRQSSNHSLFNFSLQKSFLIVHDACTSSTQLFSCNAAAQAK